LGKKKEKRKERKKEKEKKVQNEQNEPNERNDNNLEVKKKLSWIFSERNISFLSLVISGLTLYLGYIAYNKLLVDNVKTEQLNLVIELVETIQKDEIKITSYRNEMGFMGGPAEQKGNIYSISTWDEFNLDYDIYLLGNFTWELKSDEYLFNPLLPETIAKSLHKFRTDLHPRWDIKIDTMQVLRAIGKSPDSTYLYLGNMPRAELQMGMWMYTGGMRGFVSNAKNVRNEIIDYFSQNQIETINPLIFEKANIWYPYNQSKFDQIKRQFDYNDAQTHMYFEVHKNIRRKSDSLRNTKIDSLERRKIIDEFIESEVLKIEELSNKKQ